MHYAGKLHLPQINGNRTGEIKQDRKRERRSPLLQSEAYRLHVRFGLDAGVSCPSLPSAITIHTEPFTAFLFFRFCSMLWALRFSCAARRSPTCSLHYQHPACQSVSLCSSFCGFSGRQNIDVIGWAGKESSPSPRKLKCCWSCGLPWLLLH